MNVSTKFRHSFIAMTLSSLAFMPAVVHAQETEESSDTSVVLEEVFVSGSRIARPEFSQPSPVVSLTAEEIQRFATGEKLCDRSDAQPEPEGTISNRQSQSKHTTCYHECYGEWKAFLRQNGE